MRTYYLLALGCTVFSSVAHIGLKRFAVERGFVGLASAMDIRLLFGVVCFVVGALMGIAALTRLDFSVFYSITALTYLFIAALSRWHLKERFDAAKLVGGAIVVMGIVIFNL